jgi:hypothetical protein
VVIEWFVVGLLGQVCSGQDGQVEGTGLMVVMLAPIAALAGLLVAGIKTWRATAPKPPLKGTS